MKKNIFPYSTSTGKLDPGVQSEIEVELSEEQEKRLLNSAHEGGRYRLDEDDDITDIYFMVLQCIEENERDLILENTDVLLDALSWNPDWDGSEITDEDIEWYLDGINIFISYPKELQGLECTVQDNAQSSVEYIILDRDDKSIEENKDKVIYVDEGETLFYIPRNYSGKFEVKSGTTGFEKHVFAEHKKIREIIIPDGINAIPEWCFEQCEKLEKISIPGSVKDIEFNAFTKCYALKKVTFNEGIEIIHHTAFRFCSKLTQIVLPESVKSISAEITSYNNGITDIYINGMDTEIEIGHTDMSRKKLHIKKGSRAESIAVENGLKYELL